MEEITVREFVGGSEDGTLDFVPPGGTKHVTRTFQTTDLEQGIEGQEYQYEFDREEIVVVKLRKWIYTPKKKTH